MRPIPIGARIRGDIAAPSALIHRLNLSSHFITMFKRIALLLAATAVLATMPAARAQVAYGVDPTGNLYTFTIANPLGASLVGNIGFAPAGIDFNPFNGQLYGLSITATNGALYTISLSNAASTMVGSGFALSGTATGQTTGTSAAYNLTGATSFGFDFNPKTLQLDNSIRIRLIGNDGSNVRLNSSTGAISNADGTLSGGAGFVGAAYISNFAELATAGGATTLYDINSITDQLFTQNPPNPGTTGTVGSLGIDAGPATGFDVYTSASGSNTAYLVTDALVAPGTELYTVNLTTGSATLLSPNIGAGLNIVDIAVQPVPEPGTWALMALSAAGLLAWRRRRH